MEKRVTDVLENLRDKKEISIEQYNDLSPSGSRPGIMYGLANLLDLFCVPSVHQHTNLQSS